MTETTTYDVAVIGGGPGGSSVATHLARTGLRVGLFEREVFPRFHVGESLMPAVMVMLERLGVRERVETTGFQIKYGAQFLQQETGLETTFYFQPGRAWPVYSYQVPRAEFDTLLLDNARQSGVSVHQPAPVASVDFDTTGATLVVEEGGARRTVRARFVVDASGRDGFLATRLGRRQRIPNLGKVALFGHFKGAERLSGKEEGNIRVYLFDDGWFWWIPLAGDVTSVGAVLHAKTMKAWEGSPEACFAEMIRRCTGVAEGLKHAQLITPVHRAANFAYKTRPIVGDRFLMIGDAVAFVDPIFSGGVYIAMRTAELAAESITEAFARDRFTARYFSRYERRVWSGLKPFFKFIHKYYEPGFIELFMKPKNVLGSVDSVLNVLSGGSFLKMTWRTRFGLLFLFNAARMNTWRRKRAGKPIESKLEW